MKLLSISALSFSLIVVPVALAKEPVPPFSGSVERLEPALDKLIAPGTQVEALASGFNWSEGPVWYRGGIVFSDVPWAVAWYADRTCAWLPMEQEQFFVMRDLAKRQNVRVGGLLLTPESVKGENLGEIFTGENHDWTPVILRGLIAGFGTDTLGQSDLPFREILPLAGHQPRNGRLVAEMTFMSDRRPWEHPEEPAPSKVSEKSVGSKVEQEPAR